MNAQTGRSRRTDRLRRPRDFRYVASHGRRAAGWYFVVVVAPAASGRDKCGPRLGLSVSRKVGGAVARNRVKRRVREWFRSARRDLGEAVDVVVIARAGSAELSTAETWSSLADLARDALS